MATVRVKGFSVIRDVLGKEVVEVAVDEPAAVGRVFDILLEKYGKPFRDVLWDPETGRMTPFLMRLNEEIIRSTSDMGRQVRDGDEIAIIFPIGGG